MARQTGSEKAGSKMFFVKYSHLRSGTETLQLINILHCKLLSLGVHSRKMFPFGFHSIKLKWVKII